MSEKTSLKQTALFSLLPILLLLLTDSYISFLQPHAVSAFAVALLIAQLLCCLVFVKGDICPGQRGRLLFSHHFFTVFWLVWLVINIAAEQFSISMLFSYLCGLAMCLIAAKQPFDNEKLRSKLLQFSALLGVVGIISYITIMPSHDFSLLIYNPISQLFIGVVLANFALVISRSRLQNFIALLPFAMAVVLLLNVIFVLLVLSQQLDHLSNEFAVILYFVLHLILMFFIALHIIKKQKLAYFELVILLLLSMSLPIWAVFFQIHL
ncbi:hypothetical protein ACT2CV_00280 [Pasteurellaceae bacterium 22721_9_1]